MADRMAAANGVFSAAAQWQTIDATAKLVSEAAATAMTTAYVESAAFTPGAITIDGIAVLVASRVAAPVGTITIRLAQAGATVVGTELAINVSDIDVAEAWANSAVGFAGGSGWYFFKFAAPVLLVVATAYTVSAKCSTAGEVTLNRNATAGNWSRLLRTTAGGAAPAAGDNLYILGEWTAAATKTNRAITMDIAAATDYGDAVAGVKGFCIGKGGTLTWGTTAATNYQLRLSTSMAIYAGGIMTMGTVATPVPRGGTATLEFDCAADGDFGLYCYGTLIAQGLSRTIAKIIDRCKLNGDEAAAQTTLSVDTDTGWLNADEIALASTTRTPGEAETRILNGAAGATTLAVTAGLTNAHSGTAPTQAEMILLTRNVKIWSVSTTAMTFVYCGVASQVDCDWVEFRYIGANGTRQRGIEISTTDAIAGTVAGNVNFAYCSVRNSEWSGFHVVDHTALGPPNNFFLSFIVGYKVSGLADNNSLVAVVPTVATQAGTNWSVTDCTCISGNNTTGACFTFFVLNGVVQRINASSGSAGILVDLGVATLFAASGTQSDWTAHSCTGSGIALANLMGGTFSNLIAWRFNGGIGINFLGYAGYVLIETFTVFGSATNMAMSGTLFAPVMFRNGTVAGDTTFAAATGFSHASATTTLGQPVIFENTTFGPTSGIFVAHTQSDINFSVSSPKLAKVILRNCPTLTKGILNLASLIGRSGIFYQKKGQVAGTHQTQYGTFVNNSGGVIDLDTGTFKTAAPSEKLTPTGANATVRLRSKMRRIPVSTGQAMAVSVWVQKTAPYTGLAPRLIVQSNNAIGVPFTVLDTMTVADSVWEQLTGTVTAATDNGVLEVAVEVTGSAGSVYVDDWAAAVA